MKDDRRKDRQAHRIVDLPALYSHLGAEAEEKREGHEDLRHINLDLNLWLPHETNPRRSPSRLGQLSPEPAVKRCGRNARRSNRSTSYPMLAPPAGRDRVPRQVLDGNFAAPFSRVSREMGDP
jgi:hypothetical protein